MCVPSPHAWFPCRRCERRGAHGLCLRGVLSLSSNCHLQGKDAVPFLEGLVVGDVAGIPNGSGSLSVFTNEKGGIIDDTVITKVPLSHSCPH